METEYIYSVFDINNLNTNIYKYQNNQETQLAACYLSELENYICDLCYAENIYNVRLFGSKAYAENIKKNILYNNNTKFNSKNNIEVRIN